MIGMALRAEASGPESSFPDFGLFLRFIRPRRHGGTGTPGFLAASAEHESELGKREIILNTLC